MPVALLLVGVVDLVAGTVTLLLGAAHLGVVLFQAARGKGFGGAVAFEYDFRFYSLVLVGLALIVPAALCVWSVRGLTRSERPAWSRALWSSVALLAVNVPMIPVQGFAVLLTALAAVNLALLSLRRRSRPDGPT